MLKKISFIIFLILNINLIFSSNLYADIQIDVQNDGRVNIDGITNSNQLKNITNSQIYTSKKGEYWVFNLTTNQVFEDFIFKLNLPKNVEVNYIKTTPHFRIEDNGDSISIIGLGTNKKLDVVVQYKIKNEYSIFSHQQIIAFLIGLLVFAIIFSIVVGIKYYFGPVKVKKEIIKEDNEDKIEINLDMLPQRQKEIVEIVKKKEKISQKELQEIMNIPKSSVSRNVNSLVTRNILNKEKSGVTKYLFLKK